MAFSLVSEHKSAQTSGQQLAAGCDEIYILKKTAVASSVINVFLPSVYGKQELQSAGERSLFFFKQKQKET